MSKIKISVKTHRPLITIDGKVVTPVLYGLSDFPAAASSTAQAHRNIARFGKAGINLINVDTSINLGWHKTTPFEPDAMLAEIANAVEANPNAKVLVRLHLNPPYWWMRDNPDECIIYRTPEGDTLGIDNGESDRLIRDDNMQHMRVSLASEKWIDDASENLAILCEALSKSDEGKALLGIQVACGIFGEWHQWGTDVSLPMKRRFVRFLSDKYRSEQALQKSWNNPDICFETAEFHPENFRPGDDGNFRDPARSRYIMDAQECIQTTTADAILHFCHVIKQNLPDILAGAFYGYYLGIGGDDMTRSGHLQVGRMYDSADVDFLCGPFCYMENRRADGVPMQRGLLEASRVRGMLWLTEMDQHPECVPQLGGDLSKTDSTIATLRRNVLQPIAAGQGMWYYDHRVIPSFVADHPELAASASIYRKTGWWEDEYLMKEIESLHKIAEDMIHREYKPASDVLLVYDTDSYYIRSKVFDYDYDIQVSVARCGVSFDSIYMSELEHAEIERYKCVIFVNAYMQTPAQRDKCRKLTEHCMRVHLYAEGFSDGKTLAEENISAAVGMKIKRIPFAVSLTCCGLLEGVTVEIPTEALNPLFAVSDSDAVPIAHYEGGEIAAAIKGNDVWLGTSKLTREIIEPIIRKSGAHIYSVLGDPIIAGGGIVAVNCVEGGTKTILLRNGKHVDVTVPPYTTVVFDEETGRRII
ncbi:MAG: hypothetical protein PUE13_08775 [Clostridiales bacterium]|nr:hypothetical protein [Clostridiales bacterium]